MAATYCAESENGHQLDDPSEDALFDLISDLNDADGHLGRSTPHTSIFANADQVRQPSSVLPRAADEVPEAWLGR